MRIRTQRAMESRRPMTQSERVKMQPRDSRGRFAGFDTVMVVDEFGNIGEHPRKSENTFGYAVSVTEKPDAFGEVTADSRWRTGSEKKARDDLDHQMRMTSRIARQGTRTYAYYVDKNRPPKGWEGEDRRAVMLRMLDRSVEETLPETRGDVYVIVDNHSAYKSAIRPMMQSKSRPWKNVDGDKYNSHDGPFMDMLQTHDYVANAVRGDVEVDDKRRTRILKTRIRRFVGDDLHG